MNTSKLQTLVEARWIERLVIIVILINSVTLGLETIPNLDPAFKNILIVVDKIFLTLFSIELVLKMLVYRSHFFKDPWRIFDFVVVGIALLPATGALSVLRALRVLRVLRLISAVPSLRRVVNGLITAIPGLGSVAAVIALLFYVASVICTKLFAADFPEWFGDIGSSAYTLFQVMTLESWSMGIVRPVMEKHPYAWLFFLPFILIATFTMLNLFIAVIVNAMQSESEKASEDLAQQGQDERRQIMEELRALRAAIDSISKR